MSPADPDAFARDWEAAWNSHDLSRILAHCAEDVLFRSRKAVALTGSGAVRGRAALRAYWAEALSRQPDLRFSVREVFEGHDMIAITYVNQKGVLAVETLCFGPEGLVVEASACHRRR